MELAGALERAADAPMIANSCRSNAQPLQLGGGDLVANVERLRDERRLLELRLLNAGERAIIGNSAALDGGCNQLRIDLLASERRFDERLALLDHPCPSFGRCGKAHRDGRRARASDQPGRGIACPGNKPEQHQKKHRLKRCGNAEAAEPEAVVDKQVAIAKKARRCGQYLRHVDPAPNQHGAPERVAKFHL